MKKISVIIALLAIIILGKWYFLASEQIDNGIKATNIDPLNTSYLIEGESFPLVNGKAEREILPESSTKDEVMIFGEPAFGDIDGDGDSDAVVLLVNNPGGTGTFFYAAIAANIDGEYKGTDAILLGDRIAPQTFYIKNRRAIINYASRAPEEDILTQPSIGKSLHLQFDPDTLRLIEVAVDFEGEADSGMMTLDMKTWEWIKTVYSSDTEITPDKPGSFSLAIKNDGSFSARTDCNQVSGIYKVVNNHITFSEMVSTMMFCEGSQEQEFTAMLSQVQSFMFTNRGELILELKIGSGLIIFR